MSSQKYPISVFIITKNEEDRIVKCIESVRDWVDEVIVIDSGSEDETVKLSEAAGARVLFNAWQGYGAQKSFGEKQCRNEWILNIDADEVITETLAEEMKALFRNGHQEGIYGYRVNTITVLPTFVTDQRYPYPRLNFIRLYNVKYGQYSQHRVHDVVVMDEAHVSKIPFKGFVDHYTIRDLSDIIVKFNKYSDEQIQTIMPPTSGLRIFLFNIRIIFEFPLNFFKFYFLRRFCFYGMYGFILAMIHAFARFQRVAKVYEKNLKEKEIRNKA